MPTVPTIGDTIEDIMAKKQSKQPAAKKSSVKRRSRVVKSSQVPTGSMPGGEQDSKRRLGNFTTAGEHARIGGRTSGIVGQTTKRSRTDNRQTKKNKAK
jgi:hypothetical protein